MKLADKVCIVTGGSRGIGKAISIAYAKEGAKVVVAARTEEEGGRVPGTIHKTIEEIKAFGGQAIAVRCDVSNEEDVEAMVKKTSDEFGRIDVLFNNAGINYIATVADIPVRRWDLVMRVNVRGPFLCSKAVLPQMKEQRSGSIINMSSGGAQSRKPDNFTYAMSKAALERFTYTLAEEVREYNIAVNALTPGPIKTEGATIIGPPDGDWSGWKIPEVVAPPAIFLAVQDAKSFTGRLVHTPEFRITWP
jgi:NAD(P)-dependent dehydrogenase (short-subunit alcohol dehydrogenase family)